MPGLTLTKHHGLGNDFLVLIDLDGAHPVDEALARALCDRHRGVGADGVIRVSGGPADGSAELTFELRNADGSPAEMSGNGMRCLAQAALSAGIVEGPVFSVATPAGSRRVTVRPAEAPGVIWASVEMGTPHREGELISVDSRPSDALALALRLDCPIFVDETVLKSSKLAASVSDKVNNEDLRRWLENLNDEDLGRYKM